VTLIAATLKRAAGRLLARKNANSIAAEIIGKAGTKIASNPVAITSFPTYFVIAM
jgi:hypothetical protein